MADRGIIFSQLMVRALIAGRKTQTRRLKFTGARGDRLWVREAFRATAVFESVPPRDITSGTPLHYCADQTDPPWGTRYRHARHMPRWASRLTLIVESVSREPLHAISEHDAQAEGLVPSVDGGWAVTSEGAHWRPTARASFASLWDSLHNQSGERWDDNPLVCAVKFRLVRANIDTLGEARL